MTSNISGAPSVSPFHEYWASRSVSNSWEANGRLSLPEEVSGYAVEVAALGTQAGFADLSHRSVTKVSGAETIAFLGALTGGRDDGFAAGQDRAIVWCDADGFVRGSGRVAMRTSEDAILASAVPDGHWFKAASEPFDVQLTQVTAAGLRVTGPEAGDIIDALAQGIGGTCDVEVAGLGPVLAFRSDRGAIDLWCRPEEALGLAWSLEQSGARPCGVRAMRAWATANGLLTPKLDWMPVQWAETFSEARRRENLLNGGYSVLGWGGAAPAGVSNAVYWPALSLTVAIAWLPSQPGQPHSAPSGSMVLGGTATD